jgi:sugar phosphate isomerase/epimerase
VLKIGIESSGYFAFEKEEEGVALARKHGYECLDYKGLANADSPLFQRSATEYERYLSWLGAVAKRAGITFSQAHGLWPKDDSSELTRKETLAYYKRQIEGCAYLGCEHLVVHPVMPFGWGVEKDAEFSYAQNVETLQNLVPYAKEYGVKICLENMPFRKGEAFSTVEEWLAVLKAVDDGYAKAYLDTGHLNVMGEDPYVSVLAIQKYLGAMHVHDNRWGVDMHLLPYQGTLDWEGLIRGLQEIGFDGYFSLETSIADGTPSAVKARLQIALADLVKEMVKRIEG